MKGRYFTADEFAILSAIATRLKISRSAVIRHLLLYQGMCGGDMPLTTQILALPDALRDGIIAEIREAAEQGKPFKKQGFGQWIKDCLGSSSAAAQEKGAGMLIEQLLGLKPQPVATA